MREYDQEILRQLARKYIWWKSSDITLCRPQRIVAQVMNLGDYDDVQRLAHHLGDEALRQALRNAEPGQFNERSWTYWHYRLGLSELHHVPPLPARNVP